MKAITVLLLAGALLTLTMMMPAPASAQDDYWVNHWGWYDNVYRPYYYRSYYGPAYSTYYGPAYSPGVYSGPGYYSPYYGPYYGTPAVGVYPGAGVARVGPLRFGWR